MMSTEIATFERVKAAVEALHQAGAKATADAVHAEIGGGSKPTILKHLRTLREALNTPPDPLPLALLEKAKPILAEIFGAGAAAQESRTKEQTDRYHRIMADLEAQLEEFETAAKEQEQQSAALRRELTEAQSSLSEAQAQLADANIKIGQREAEIEDLQSELARRQRDEAQTLASRFEAFESRIADLSDKLERRNQQVAVRSTKTET